MKRMGTPLALLFTAMAVIFGPLFIHGYNLVLAFGFFLAAGMAMSWNLVGGIAGQFALGHAMYVGVGSYAVALLSESLGWPVALAAGALVSSALAAASAALFLRMRSAYFSVATLGLALMCMAGVVTSPALGATAGLTLPGDLPIDDRILFWTSGGLILITLIVTWRILMTPFGLSLMAVRDDEQAAAEVGVNPLILKCVIMGLSGLIAGAFGGLAALQKLSVEPYSAFSMSWTINMIMIAVIGGLGTVWGPILGTLIVYGTQQALEDLAIWNLLVTALILIAVIRLAPGGLTQLLGLAFKRFSSRKKLQ